MVTHAPHLIHLLWSITNGDLITPLIAPTGQPLEHLEQPLHLSGCISIRFSFWQTPAGQRFSLMCASYSSRKFFIVLTTGEAADLPRPQSAVAEIAGFTRQRQEELEQARERETALQVQAEKRRAINRSRTGFDPTPEDFSPRLTDRQLDLLTEHINRIGLFRRDVTRPEVELLLACQLPEPLQTTHNKLLALLLESLSAARFITPKWQRVAGAKGCFLSKLGKPLTAKDLSAAKQMADIIDAKREQQILDCIRALEAAQS